MTGAATRRLAAEALVRIDTQGAYANLVTPALLATSDLADRDRALVTNLVYGATRQRAACDWLVDRYLQHPPDPPARALLRLGAYQLRFLGTPPHAAVSATVEASPKRLRGLVNAVLRRLAAEDPPAWPDEPTRLSYPAWIVDRLVHDLGRDDALAALEAMNDPAPVTTREDGYIQDPASSWVAAAVGAGAGELVFDACAAPGGKATLLAGTGAVVVAGDSRWSRLGLVTANARRVGVSVHPVALDAARPPWSAGAFDRVLVDAPCSGLGSLRRRPDARWRVEAADVERLAGLQRDIIGACLPLVRPGGVLVYSVCTSTAAETTGIDEWLAGAWPEATALGVPELGQWRPAGRGALVLPQDAGTDGMFVLVLQAPS